MKLLYTLKRNLSLNSKSPMYNFMDLDITQSYTHLGFNKQKTCGTNGEFVGYSIKGYN